MLRGPPKGFHSCMDNRDIVRFGPVWYRNPRFNRVYSLYGGTDLYNTCDRLIHINPFQMPIYHSIRTHYGRFINLEQPGFHQGECIHDRSLGVYF